ncbi:NAD(P)-dependent oxidoreductase [Litorihabitans aurantiacus]|uniref:NAD(P)-dependent oxidoreductase n=1 Tax=Litorihabitans aurantiacus TaxID=1930061 RepID=A0AA37XGP3_9MICO|nr:NAD(P)-dependent oxidoreductase [Litorihabitans aurantiacus]
MQSRLIAVTGATGHLGRAVTADLAARGERLRLVVRDPSRAPEGPHEVVMASYGDGDAARLALAGVDTLLLVSASESADRLEQHRTVVDAAVEAGVRHVVYTSFLGAAPDATFTLARDHWATEEHLRATGVAHTFLRDSFYLDLLPEFADESGAIRGPAGAGRVGAVARADVARAAAAVLVDPDAHAGRAYELTGPEALTLGEVAAVVTEVTGRPTRYVDETLPEAHASRAAFGAPAWQVEAWISTYIAIAVGEVAAVTDDVERLTGRAPLSLAEVLRGSRPRWLSPRPGPRP